MLRTVWLCLLMWSGVAAADLQVLSYNVYFDDDSGAQRYPAILDYLEQVNADVVALQEVTPNFLQRLQASPLATRYHFTPRQPRGRYFNLTLSKKEPVTGFVEVLPSRMGRAAVVVDLQFADRVLRVINVHLESLDSATSQHYRVRQIAVLDALLLDHNVVLGDFNFTLGGVYDEGPLLGLADVAASRRDWGGVTYDIDANPLAAKTADWGEPSRRLDRVYCSSRLTASDYRLTKLLHSDHFPIRVRIGWNESAQ